MSLGNIDYLYHETVIKNAREPAKASICNLEAIHRANIWLNNRLLPLGFQKPLLASAARNIRVDRAKAYEADIELTRFAAKRLGRSARAGRRTASGHDRPFRVGSDAGVALYLCLDFPARNARCDQTLIVRWRRSSPGRWPRGSGHIPTFRVRARDAPGRRC